MNEKNSVTFGRDYDRGQRHDPEKNLREGGVQEPLLFWLIGSKGLRGQAAKTYLNDAPEEIKKLKISRKQQYALFTPVYFDMKNEIIRISSTIRNKEIYGNLDWENIHPKIKNMIIDLIYRGDYHKEMHPFIQIPFVTNDYATPNK